MAVSIIRTSMQCMSAFFCLRRRIAYGLFLEKIILEHVRCKSLNEENCFLASVQVSLPNRIKSAQATFKTMSMLRLLIVIGVAAVRIERISFVIGKQIALIARKNDFFPCKRSFIQSVSKSTRKYLQSTCKERMADR